MPMQVIRSWWLVALLCSVVLSCSDSGLSPTDDGSGGGDASDSDSVRDAGAETLDRELRIQAPDDPFLVGDEAPLRARWRDENGRYEEAHGVSWTISDEAIIALDVDQGRMRADAPGTVELQASVEQESASLEIAVEEALQPELDIVADEVFLARPTQRERLEVITRDEEGQRVESPNIRWTSSNEDIVRVSNGVLRPITVGDATVHASWRAVDDEVAVGVRDVATMEIEPSDRELMVGDRLQLEVVHRARGGERLEPSVDTDWASSTSEVASVDEDGLLEAHQGGQTTLTVHSGGEMAETTFYVDVAYRDISCSEQYCCAISTQGDLYCWGQNWRGNLGVGDRVDREFPTAVQAPAKFTRITTEAVKACALDEDGKPWCWGADVLAGLVLSPQEIQTEEKFEEVELAGATVTALDSDGALWAWGVWPLLSDFDDDDIYEEPFIIDPGPWERFEELATRSNSTICLRDATKSKCIGDGHHGLGLGEGMTDQYFDDFVAWGGGNPDITELVGHPHDIFCGLDHYEKVWCSGIANSNGGLGHPVDPQNPEEPRHYTPERTDWSDTFEQLFAGLGNLCGTRDGLLWCWGWNHGCQLGFHPDEELEPQETHNHEPVLIELPYFKAVGLMRGAGCIIAENGELICWGKNKDPNHHAWSHEGTKCDPVPRRLRPYEKP